MTTDCLFCKIIDGQIPATLVHQDDRLVVFKDINPQAALHVLVVPRRHIATLNDLQPGDDGLVGEMVRRAAAIAAGHGYDARGYRAVDFLIDRPNGLGRYVLELSRRPG